MISLIAAVAQNGVIGNRNAMPWHLSEDFKHFKALTTGHTVVMGRNTWESIGRPLPNRRNVVVSRTMQPVEGVEVVGSTDEALSLCGSDEELFVMGGGAIYAQAIDRADKLCITHIYCNFDGDVRFPAIDPEQWQQTKYERFESGRDFPYPFAFAEYVRKGAKLG